MKTGTMFKLVISIIIFCTPVNILPQNIDEFIYPDTEINPDTTSLQKGKNNLFDESDELPYIKNDFIINTHDGEYGSDQSNVSIASDGLGYSAFVWIDKRNAQKEIYAQFYDPDRNRIGPNIKVNDGLLKGNNSPYISANKKGDYVVVWLQDYSTVAAQRFNWLGQKTGGNIFINTIYGFDKNSSQPCAAVNDDGSFLVMWASESAYGKYKLYSRLISNTGIPAGDQITIVDTLVGGFRNIPGKFISVDAEGNYYLCWNSYGVSNYSNIYLQRLTRQGYKLGGIITVSSTQDSSNNYSPEIVTTADGYSFIIWSKEKKYHSEFGVSARICRSDNSFVTDEIIISEPDNKSNFYSAVNWSDSLFLCIIANSYTPYFQWINKSGQYVNDTLSLTFNPNDAAIFDIDGFTAVKNDRFITAVSAYNRSDINVYFQEFDFSLQPVGGFNKINDDTASSNQIIPNVKFNSFGQSLVLWEDSRNGRKDLYAQVFDENFNPVNGNIQINDAEERWFLYNKEIGVLSDGTFIVLYSGSSGYSQEIWLQAINKNGEKSGQSILVNSFNHYNDFNLALNVNNNDEILVCWYDNYGAYLKRYDKNLHTIYNEKKIIASSGKFNFSPLNISIDTSLSVFAVWRTHDYQSQLTDRKIFGSFYNKNGIEQTEAFLIDSTNSSYILCSHDGKNYAVVLITGLNFKILRYYTSYKTKYINLLQIPAFMPLQLDIIKFENMKLFLTYLEFPGELCGLFINDNKRIPEKYKIHNYNLSNFEYNNFTWFTSTDIYNDKLFFLYQNNSNIGTGNDIWGNVRALENVSFGSEIFYPPVSCDFLYNNYPNPFNSKTKIVYELLAFHSVKLAIYDILGREVKVLVNENQEKGLYEIEFDASGLASGVYFYRLDSFDTTIKKMMILK